MSSQPLPEKHGIEVVDTDLGERIVQLRKEPPSHIVLPAIHIKRRSGRTISRTPGHRSRGQRSAIPHCRCAEHLRQKFLAADAAITGVNFAVAETGAIVVCTNEGNADLGAHLAKVHIACMGIEKVIPKRPTSVCSFACWQGAQPDRPSPHITVISANLRRIRRCISLSWTMAAPLQLGREAFRNSLKCIRCGACMNTCPVYRRSGGHSYHNAVAGPIGAILAPNIDMKEYADLPFASTSAAAARMYAL